MFCAITKPKWVTSDKITGIVLDLVVQRVDKIIHSINHHPVDNAVVFVNKYAR